MIDKHLFPKEYAAIERLKNNSRRYESEKSKRRKAKQAEIEKWREILNEDDHIRRSQ